MIRLSLGPALGVGTACLWAGVLLVYLASANQCMRRVQLGRGARRSGLLLLVAALGVFGAGLGAIAAVATWVVVLILAATLIPLAGLLWQRRP